MGTINKKIKKKSESSRNHKQINRHHRGMLREGTDMEESICEEEKERRIKTNPAHPRCIS
jgi:hypothetical protein